MDDVVTVRVIFSPNRAEVGTVKEMPRYEASILVREGRVRYADQPAPVPQPAPEPPTEAAAAALPGPGLECEGGGVWDSARHPDYLATRDGQAVDRVVDEPWP